MITKALSLTSIYPSAEGLQESPLKVRTTVSGSVVVVPVLVSGVSVGVSETVVSSSAEVTMLPSASVRASVASASGAAVTSPPSEAVVSVPVSLPQEVISERTRISEIRIEAIF